MTWNDAQPGHSLTYNGRKVSTIATVEPHGINLRVTFTNGYEIVVAPNTHAPLV